KSMLTLMAINIQAARALLYRTCALIDMADAIRHHLENEGATNGDRTALQAELEHDTQLTRFFTPLCKYYATEISNHVTRQGIQLHGGGGHMAGTAAGPHPSDPNHTTPSEGASGSPASVAPEARGEGGAFAGPHRARPPPQHL